MKAEEIFYEVMKSPELQEIFEVSENDLLQETLNTKSSKQIVEIIQTIIGGQEHNRSKDAIFHTIQKQIMQL